MKTTNAGWLISLTKISFATAVLLAVAKLAFAAEHKQARVTEKFNDVRLLSPHVQPRPAVVNDNVHEGTAVRTGTESRAELTFIDQTIARLGANTVFNVGGAGRTYDLSSGAILMYAPNSAGAVKVNTPVATAAVTGFTAMVDAGRYTKLIILEGDADIWLNKHSGEHKHMHSGQLISIPPGATKLPPVWDVDICKLISNGRLITGFTKKLPSWNLILAECERQHEEQPGTNRVDPTNIDALDQSENARPTPPPAPTRTPGGGRRN
jgi:hypothetical protein